MIQELCDGGVIRPIFIGTELSWNSKYENLSIFFRHYDFVCVHMQ